MNDLSEFPEEIAASRTFVFVREVEMLRQNNLIKGGDLDNAIVIYDQKMPQETLDKLADEVGIPHKDVCDLGYINNKPLVFDNEPARHKLIDVLGDLALIGKPIRGRIIATRPGHKINNQLAHDPQGHQIKRSTSSDLRSERSSDHGHQPYPRVASPTVTPSCWSTRSLK